MDMVIPFAIVAAYNLTVNRASRGHHFVTAAILFLVAVAGQTIFRRLYYGDWLPNTYYLKLANCPVLDRLKHGVYVLGSFLFGLNPLIPAIAIVGAFLVRDRRLMLLLALFVGQVAYSVWVGGDAWEHLGGANRFIAVTMPCFFLLLGAVLSRGWERWKARGVAAVPSATRSPLAWIIVIIILLQMNSYRALTSLEQFLLLAQPVEMLENHGRVPVAVDLERCTTRGAVIAVPWAGVVPYFTHRRFVDLLGKSDRRIARLPVRPLNPNELLWKQFIPGHMKWDYDYSILERRPDIVFLFTLAKPTSVQLEFIRRMYHPLVLGGMEAGALNNSPYVVCE